MIEHCLPKDIEDEAGTSDDLRDHAIKVLKGARSMDSKNALLIGKHGKALEMLNEDPEKVLKCYKYALKKLQADMARPTRASERRLNKLLRHMPGTKDLENRIEC